MDFVEICFPRTWFEQFLTGRKPKKESVVARIYPEKPLFLGNPEDRAVILSWFNSFRAYQYDLLKKDRAE